MPSQNGRLLPAREWSFPWRRKFVLTRDKEPSNRKKEPISPEKELLTPEKELQTPEKKPVTPEKEPLTSEKLITANGKLVPAGEKLLPGRERTVFCKAPQLRPMEQKTETEWRGKLEGVRVPGWANSGLLNSLETGLKDPFYGGRSDDL